MPIFSHRADLSGVLQAVSNIGSKTKDRKIGRIRVSLIIEIRSCGKNGLGGRDNAVCEMRQIWQIDAAFVFYIYIFRMEEYAAFEACIMDELPITVNRFDLFPSAYAV